MLRKTTAAVVLAGALALGTASATSLGTFDDVSFAASSVDLIDCEVVSDALALVPAVPEVDTELSALPTDTFALDGLDLSMLSSLDTDCGPLLDVVVIGYDSAVDGTEQVLDVVTITDFRDDTEVPDLSKVTLDTVLDVALVTEVRLVLRNA